MKFVLLAAVDRGFGRVTEVMAVCVAISIGALTVAIIIDFALRFMDVGNIFALNESIEYALYAGVMLSAPWVLRQGAHIEMDAVFLLVPKDWRPQFDKLINLLGAGISGVLCYYGSVATFSAYASSTRQFKTLTIDTWWPLAIFAFSALLLTVEFLFRLRRERKSSQSENAADGVGF